MPERITLAKTNFRYNTTGILPAILLLLLFTHFLPLLSLLHLNSSSHRTIVVAQHSQSFLRHLDLAQYRSIDQDHLEPTEILRPTICLERAAVKVLLPLSFLNIATLYEPDRLLPLTTFDRTGDEILIKPVHNILILSMHATVQHVPLLCPSTGICPLQLQYLCNNLTFRIAST